MSGRIDDLSPDQTKALSEFRERIKDVATERCDDIYLLRFLRARSFDLDKAEAKIRATLEFKKKYGADTILKDWKPNSTFENHFPSNFFFIFLYLIFIYYYLIIIIYLLIFKSLIVD